ncbi:MAG: hypothetical protein EOS50_01305 [Mesorhizobium sp.]|nr:MAG: hypothetical protein EOS50_01305 [Mesorhizobium sp.]
MANRNEPYRFIEVESYREKGSGLHGDVHIRPVAGGHYPTSIRVECPREMRDTGRFPLGTRFSIKVKLTDRAGSGDFLYSHHSWAYTVLS